jgi:D-aminopeptidase
MSCFGFKGGIGTSSRVISDQFGGWTVGVLVLSNFGQPEQLVVDGVPVGRYLAGKPASTSERGSIMFVVATDAPLMDRQLKRIAKRTAFGLARTGSIAGHGSGDIAIAFSTHPSVRVPHDARGWSNGIEMLAESGPGSSSNAIDALFAATIEATEESILNSLFMAETVVGRDGNRRAALPIDQVLALIQATRNGDRFREPGDR